MSVHGKRFARSTAILAGTCLLHVGLLSESALCQSRPVSKGRTLAPDALHVIPSAAEFGETFQGPVDLPLVVKHPELAWTPNYASSSDTLLEKARQVIFRGDTYCLEFAFKTTRMIELDVATPTGIQRKTVWYLLYRVRYTGGDLQPVPEKDAYNNQVFADPQSVSAEWVRFMPTFKLEALGLGQEYLDRPMKDAVRAIATKERVGHPVYDSLEIQKLKLKLSTETESNEVWGIATWIDVDPRTDFFSIKVQGLTNAQRLKLNGDQIQYLQKTLVLHFSRPGDTVDEIEDKIRYGIPAIEDSDRQKYILGQYGQQERLDHVWIYR